MIKHQLDQPSLSAEEKPNYMNWDLSTWLNNNPNATPKEIKQFLKDKKNSELFKSW